ncbi:MAG TPA: glucose-6-phosphate dehydrogenase [Terriglobia bacterium]|nr:glucose-6-phosphate dehydrogenase [Terriglobia bacterium]
MADVSVAANPLRVGMRIRKTPSPCSMVIFGASGDLTARKLIPALYYLHRERLLPQGFSVIGCAKTPYDNAKFRQAMADAVRKFSEQPSSVDEASLRSFTESIYYLADNFGESKAYKQLRDLLAQLDRERGAGENRLYYLATPPSSFPVIIGHLGSVGLAAVEDAGKSWTRVVIEKPFGHDLESARELTTVVNAAFKEGQVYRIDHYLGKETVQNLLVFRFANGIFEPIWNRRYIDHIEITVAEDLGVEGRGRYYEEAGLLRDMIQNHVMSVLSLVAMEPPSSFDAVEVRDEKAKVMRSMRPIDLDRLEEFVVRGQYGEGWIRGEKVPAYREEPNVSPKSTTETFAALKLFIDNWRWADVPFYVRSGKRLTKRVSEVVVQFRRVPHMVFGRKTNDPVGQNVLAMHIQPNEGISINFNAKFPAPMMEIRPVKMEFRYAESFGGEPPSAYETLLLDSMLGDQTLFNREDAVELAWQLLTPLLERWQEDGEKSLQTYEAGSWGPEAADRLLDRDGRRWHRL